MPPTLGFGFPSGSPNLKVTEIKNDPKKKSWSVLLLYLLFHYVYIIHI